MFNFLKSDPKKKLRKQYDELSTQAMLAQRNGDIRGYAELTAQAETIWQKIESLDK